MDQVKPEIRACTERNLTAILRAFRSVTQAKVAELMGVSPTAVSRMKDSDLPEIAALLAACGLKVVPEAERTYPIARIQALTTLAREALDRDGLAGDADI